jgi:sugar phosphate isomerase/epimerase
VGNLAYFADRYESMEYVRFCYDFGHEHCYTKFVCWMDIFRCKLAATHIHDNLGRGEEAVGDPDLHLLPFEGNMDYARIMRKLDEYGYAGSLVLEVGNNRHEGLTPEEITERDKLRRIYIDSVKASLTGQLDNTYIVYPDGTKKKVQPKS